LQGYRPGVTYENSKDEQGFSIHQNPRWDGQNQPPPAGQRAQRPKATALPGLAKHGSRTPVTLTLQLASGGGGWMRVTTAQGHFMAPMDETLWSLADRVMRGQYRPVPPSPTRRRRPERR